MNDATTPLITSASVKVMRSYDYCHFEVVLGTTELHMGMPPVLTQIDNLRKEAARLADKAVEQYKIAKKVAENRGNAQRTVGWRKKTVEVIQAIPEGSRSPDEKAELKAYQDALHRAGLVYDYEDDWREQDDEDDQP